jgi:hypothetical protein
MVSGVTGLIRPSRPAASGVRRVAQDTPALRSLPSPTGATTPRQRTVPGSVSHEADALPGMPDRQEVRRAKPDRPLAQAAPSARLLPWRRAVRAGLPCLADPRVRPGRLVRLVLPDRRDPRRPSLRLARLCPVGRPVRDFPADQVDHH